jgi:hypothetical protein
MYSAKVSPAKLNKTISFKFGRYLSSIKPNTSLTQLEAMSIEFEKLEIDNTSTNYQGFDFPVNSNKFINLLEELSKVAEDEELNYEVLSSPTLSKRFYTTKA